MASWWETFFDADYLRIWEGIETPASTERQAAGLWTLLGLGPGSRVLDAPCGYGRISRALAGRGAEVLGVDVSPVLLAEAERRRGDLAAERLRYLQHDLRRPLEASGFDAALNIFSSLGYGEESDDIAVLTTLRNAVRPGAPVFVETMHRDLAVLNLSRTPHVANRLPDGTLVVEEPQFNALTGRVDTTWYWCGPGGPGHKSASVRVYSATELVRLLEAAGLRVRSAHDGASPDPFVGGSVGRLGLLAVREGA